MRAKGMSATMMIWAAISQHEQDHAIILDCICKNVKLSDLANILDELSDEGDDAAVVKYGRCRRLQFRIEGKQAVPMLRQSFIPFGSNPIPPYFFRRRDDDNNGKGHICLPRSAIFFLYPPVLVLPVQATLSVQFCQTLTLLTIEEVFIFKIWKENKRTLE